MSSDRVESLILKVGIVSKQSLELWVLRISFHRHMVLQAQFYPASL